MFPNLFSKRKIGQVEVRNRIVMLPLSTNFSNENGGVTQELIDYYAERAKGGADVIIVLT
jgi:2,4-dienoyl-CoA reductase-like NADH-dependent reductase (Old Yellow Enzyme family)